jgi:acetyl-CoA decarbonylase/synthase complex subunit beta
MRRRITKEFWQVDTFFEYPHTSCGCFEVVGFYIPELDIIVWVDRDYADPAPNGLTFANMTGQIE